MKVYAEKGFSLNESERLEIGRLLLKAGYVVLFGSEKAGNAKRHFIEFYHKVDFGAKNPPQVVTTPGAAWEKTLQTLYHNRRRIAMPYEDIQLKPWVATCDRCGDGLNEYEAEPDEWGHEYCPECRLELSADLSTALEETE